MIKLKNIVKKFNIGKENELTVIKGIDLEITEGEYVVLSGKSGAGKSTLLYQISLLSNPTTGDISYDDQNTNDLSEDERSRYRLNNFGFIFQSYALNKDLTAKENVALPLLALGYSTSKAYKIASESLESVGLGERLDSYPSQLSGGEQQRVSISRAVAKKPKYLFADEPTASLDIKNSDNVMEIIDDLHKNGMTVIAITHEEVYKNRGTRLVELSDGNLLGDTKK